VRLRSAIPGLKPGRKQEAATDGAEIVRISKCSGIYIYIHMTYDIRYTHIYTLICLVYRDLYIYNTRIDICYNSLEI
jgi:hypothetical protein